MWLWSPTAVGVYNDDGVYLLIGKAIADGEGLRYAGAVGSLPAPKFPPLYPLLLAAVWKAAPSFPANIIAFKALSLTLTVAGAGLFAGYLVRVFGLSLRWAAVLTIAAWLTVDTWRYAVLPLSEPLFTALLIVALACAASLERGEEPVGWAFVVVTVAATVAALYARSVGIVLVPAIAVGWALARQRRAAVVAAFACLLLALPWSIWTRVAAREIPTPFADVLGPYGGWLIAEIRQVGLAYPMVLGTRVLDVVNRVLVSLLPGLANAARWFVAPLVLAAAVAGAVWMWRRSRAAVLAVAAFLAVLCLWPYSARRLVAPVVPWLVLVTAAGFVAGSRSGRAPLAIASRGLGIVWGIWFVGASVLSLATRQHDRVLLERSILLMRAAEAVNTATSADAVVGAPELWAGLHLYTGRTVAPSARFKPLSTAGPPWGTPDEQIELWRVAGLSYLVLEFGGAVHGPALAVLQERCGEGAVRSVARFPGGELVRLPDFSACP